MFGSRLRPTSVAPIQALRWRFALGVSALLVAGGTAIAVAVAADARARIPGGVEIAGVAVGGVSAAAAEERVSARAQELADRPLVVVGPDGAVRTSGASSAPGPASRRLSQQPATTGSAVRAIGSTAASCGNVPLSWELRGGEVRAFARRLVRTVRPLEAAVVVGAGGVEVREGRAGYVIDVEALRSRLESLPAVVRAPTIRIPPQVTTAEARARRSASNVSLELGGRSFSAPSRPCSNRRRYARSSACSGAGAGCRSRSTRPGWRGFSQRRYSRATRRSASRDRRSRSCPRCRARILDVPATAPRLAASEHSPMEAAATPCNRT